jgi:hypothetical protein
MVIGSLLTMAEGQAGVTRRGNSVVRKMVEGIDCRYERSVTRDFEWASKTRDGSRYGGSIGTGRSEHRNEVLRGGVLIWNCAFGGTGLAGTIDFACP